MRNDSNGIGKNEIELYVMAGLATAPLFMERLRHALVHTIDEIGSLGRLAHSELLFPYGDWSRRSIPQLWEIRADMRLRLDRIEASIGGKRALGSIGSGRAEFDGSGTTYVMVGHSGGGVAAVHAAYLLLARDETATCFVIMIGSPRCRIPERLRPKTLSISASGRSKDGSRTGKSPDFISRLGSFGGWSTGEAANRNRPRMPSWRKDKYAPSSMMSVPIIGGHADYFRDSAPYLNSGGMSNLDLTVEAIRSWLIQWN
ncbi:hypothetical protein [Cohnella lupini]|uniref:Alpha/beta hydrolase family protein n=1 Tax=Cohnella lupini TaxID=1294267 RepID=A0A3D9IUX8_9BACL|nr:hypothetical protein [Cohnella lupini]RED65542.1 hypothetical protein DFP95_10130 [Cohnella lupini]